MNMQAALAEPVSNRQEKTLRIRHDDRFGAKLELASRVRGQSKSQFARSAVEREADAVLRTQSVHFMTEEDVAAFNAALDTPPAHTARSDRAARTYNRRVVHAD